MMPTGARQQLMDWAADWLGWMRAGSRSRPGSHNCSLLLAAVRLSERNMSPRELLALIDRA